MVGQYDNSMETYGVIPNTPVLEIDQIIKTASKSQSSHFKNLNYDGNEDFFLVGYVEERLWWPIQSPNKGRKEKAKS